MSFSLVAVLVCLCQLAGVGLIAWMQIQQGHWTFGWINLMKDDRISLLKVVDISFLAPLREEFAFRGVLFFTIYRRLGNDPAYALLASFLVNTVFGALHLANLLGTQFSLAYISLQCGLGVLVGTFYSVRFFVCKSLFEIICMHIVNNVCASLFSFEEINILDPITFIPRMHLPFLEYLCSIGFFNRLQWISCFRYHAAA